MRFLLLICTIVCALLAGRLLAPELGDTPPRHCEVCIVDHNNGGIVGDFKSAAAAIRNDRHGVLVIDGFCGSSCMTMADLARPHACITPNAIFAYHQTNYGRPIPLSADLHAWAMAHGGFPRFGMPPNMMPNSAARQFWPLCDSATAHGSATGAHL